MNRGQFSSSVNYFHVRLAGAQHADLVLFEDVITSLESYIENLEESYDPIDEYSLNDLCEVYSYNYYNKQYLLNGAELLTRFQLVTGIINKHKEFLIANGLAPDYILNWNIHSNV